MSSKETININWPPERTVKHSKCLKRSREEETLSYKISVSGRTDTIKLVDGPSHED